jgi:hypothetical protein
MVGFGAITAVMLGLMGLASWGILVWENQRIKSQAANAYQLQKDDFAKQSDPTKAGVLPPSESLRRLSEEGSLFAYNNIKVPKDGMSIVGYVDLTQNPPVRYLKGASQEKAVYRFPHGLITTERMMFAPVGQRPYFEFYFPMMAYHDLSKVQIHVVAQCTNPRIAPPPKPIDTTLTLREDGSATWEPEDLNELYSYVDDKGELVFDRGEISVEVSCPTGGVFLEVLDGAAADPKTQMVPADTQFNIAYVPDRSMRLVGYPSPTPKIMGFERRERQEINGPSRNDVSMPNGVTPLESAVFRFSGQDLKNVPIDSKGNFTLSLTMETYKGDNPELPTMAKVWVVSMDRLAEKPLIQDIEVAEKRMMTMSIPKECLGNPDVNKRGDMVVMVSCATRGHSISFREDSVRLELPETPFVVNLLKSEIILFFEALLLIVISVTCSVRLGWPVAMLCSCVCVMFGFFVEFIAGLQEYGGLGALNYRAIGTASATFQFFDKLTGVIWKALGLIASFVPNFTIYKPQEYISALQNTPWDTVISTGGWTIVFLTPFVALAFLLFRKQELG